MGSNDGKKSIRFGTSHIGLGLATGSIQKDYQVSLSVEALHQAACKLFIQMVVFVTTYLEPFVQIFDSV